MTGGATAAGTVTPATNGGESTSTTDSGALTDTGDLPIPTGEAGPFAVVAGRAHRVCTNQFGAECYRPKHVRGDRLEARNG